MSWGQASHLQEGVGDCEDVHRLIDELTNIRVRVGWPQRGRGGHKRAAESDRALVFGMIRRKLYGVSVGLDQWSPLKNCQMPGKAAAQGQRVETLELNKQA